MIPERQTDPSPEGARVTVIVTVMQRSGRAIDEALRETARPGVDAAEIRLDHAPNVDPQTIGLSSPIPLIATCRSRRDGGEFDGTEEERVRLLERAEATGRFRLDVEHGSLAERIQRERPGSVAVLSHHERERTPPDLDVLARELLAATRPGQLAKLVTTARSATDILHIRDLLSRMGEQERGALRSAQLTASSNGKPGRGRGRLAAFAMGDAGIASRVLAGVWGSAAIWTSAFPGAPGAPGQVPVHALLGLYRFLAIGSATRIFAVVGNPIARSLSPRMQNGAFEAMGLDAVYVPLECATAEEVLILARELPLEGASVTAPLKVAVLPWITDPDPSVARAGACNTLLFERASGDDAPEDAGDRVFDGRIRGFNTDGPAAVERIRMHLTNDPSRTGPQMAGRPVIVVGAGGAGRAIAHSLQETGADIRIANRGRARGESLAKELGVGYLPIDDIDEDPDRVLVQATSAPWEDLVVPPKALRASFLLDVRYRETEESALVLAAREAGTPAEGGRRMLWGQAEAQIRLFTGRDPRDLPPVPDA